MNDVKTTLDILFLEKDFAKDCKCQSVHRLPGSRMCSEEVVSVAVMSCEPARLICFNATLASLNWINAGGYLHLLQRCG